MTNPSLNLFCSTRLSMETKEKSEIRTDWIMLWWEGQSTSSKFSTTKVTHTWNSYMLAVLSWVISLIWKSEDKEQAHSWVGDHRDAVEKVVSLLMLIPNPHPSGTAESTALLTQNVLWELGGGTHLQIHILIIWRSIWSSIWCQTFTTLTRMIYVTLELLEGFTPSFTHL